MSQSRTIIITGCSSGIGKTAALALAAAGYEVLATVRDARSADMLRQHGCEVFQVEMNDLASIAAFAEEIHSGGRSIDAIIHNAGYSRTGAQEDLTNDLLLHQFQVNTFSPIQLTNMMLPSMKRGGRIIFISSTVAGYGLPYSGSYVASKTALESLAQSVRHELSPFGVHCSVIVCAGVHSRINENSKAVSSAGINAEDSRHKAVYERIYAPAHSLHKGLFSSLTTSPAPVVRTIRRILESPSPRFIYFPTFGARLMRIGIRLLPFPIYEKLLSRMLAPFRATQGVKQ